jgi:hypothetical protein
VFFCGTESKFSYIYMNVVLQIVQLKLYCLCYCFRHSTAASNTTVPTGQHPMSEAAEVVVEL